ncbi:DUF2061 domain-containing protein [Alcaligenaceae bacterium 429]|nr:DUF2061 domain-containing protein [Alcaligenaceae bacterium 429]
MQLIAFKTSQICLHMSVAFAVAYAFTGSLAVGGVAAVVEPICNVTLMPLHDKLWERMRQRRQSAKQPSEAVASTPLEAVATAA